MKTFETRLACPQAETAYQPKPTIRYLKSEGRRSSRLHFSHSATFFTLPLSKRAFILTSPPQEQKNFWDALEVRLFLLAWAMVLSLPAGRLCYEAIRNPGECQYLDKI